ncbi:MAG: hypothetical protein ACREMW_08230 [Gemmatimonadales bacterium]
MIGQAARCGEGPQPRAVRKFFEWYQRHVSCPHDRTTPAQTTSAGLAQVSELRRWQIDVLGDALLPALG